MSRMRDGDDSRRRIGPLDSFQGRPMSEMLGDDMMPNKHSFNLCRKSHEAVEKIKWGERSGFVSEAILAFQSSERAKRHRLPPTWRVILDRIWP